MLSNAVRRVLEAARHELVTLDGLWAHDGQPDAAPEQWQIDTTAVIAQIDAVLPPGPGPWLPATRPLLPEDVPPHV